MAVPSIPPPQSGPLRRGNGAAAGSGGNVRPFERTLPGSLHLEPRTKNPSGVRYVLLGPGAPRRRRAAHPRRNPENGSLAHRNPGGLKIVYTPVAQTASRI